MVVNLPRDEGLFFSCIWVIPCRAFFTRRLICAMSFLDGLIIIWSVIYYLFVIFGLMGFLINLLQRVMKHRRSIQWFIGNFSSRFRFGFMSLI